MRNYLYLFFLFFISASFGQSSNWDTLSPELDSYKKQDTIRLQLLLDATRYYEVRNLKDTGILFKEATQLASKLNIPKFAGRLYLAEARIKLLEGIYIEATENLLSALPLLETAKDHYYIRNATIIQAEIDRENDAFLKAIGDLKKTISATNPNEHPFQLAELYLNLGNVYMNLNKDNTYKEAITHLLQAKELFATIGNKTGVALTNTRLARYYKIESLKYDQQINHDKAMLYAKDATAVFKEQGQTANEAYGYYTMATAKSIIGEHLASIPMYKKALEKYEKIGNLNYSMLINQHLFVAYSITKQQQKAIDVNIQFATLKDSIFGIEKRQLIADAQIKFETAKIQAEKEKAEIREDRNFYYFLGTAIIASLISIASLFFFGNLKQKRKAEIITLELEETQKRLALEKQYRDSELKALKAQMNPHFIFNALNSIQEYIILNKKNLASEYLGKFADLIRKYLHFSNAGGISVEDELASLKMYLELETLRFEDTLQYNITVSENINADVDFIPTMLIQPYVENAIKHGLLHIPNNRKLKIDFNKINENTVTCIIEDNGIGRAASAQKKLNKPKTHASFATKATSSRLDLLNQSIQQKIGVAFVDLMNEDGTASGTRVHLTIPILKNTALHT